MNVGARLATRSDTRDRKATSVLESCSGRKALFAALSRAQGAVMSALTAKFASLRTALRCEVAGVCRAQTDIEETAIMQDYALRLAAVCVTTPRHLRAAAIGSLIAARTAALIEMRNRARLREAAQMELALGPLSMAYRDERGRVARTFVQSRDALRMPLSAHPRRVRLQRRLRHAGAEVARRAIIPEPIRPQMPFTARPRSRPFRP